MAGKVYEIAFKIAGQMSGGFSKSFANANKVVRGFGDNLNTLNAKAHNLAMQEKAARKEVEQLADEISKAGVPTKDLAQKFAEAENKLKGLTLQHAKAEKAAEKCRIAHERLAKATALQNKMKGWASSSAMALGAMGAAGAGVAAATIAPAMAMQDAMADVAKVTDFDPKGLKAAQEQLEKMSLRVPMAATGLAQIMASAAQSGVAKEELVAFTEQAAKMGVAFDISAEEAGTMMSKWRSGMGLTQDQVASLADATNALSNANAATAAQIGDVLMRYGAMGKVAGLSEKQVAAFATTVIASGAESNVAATGIKAFMRQLGAGEKLSKKAQGYFSAVGLDPAELQKNLQKDAPAAIVSALEAIKKEVPKERWNEYLSAMFGEESAAAVGPMMANLDALKKNFKLVGDSAGYSGSMMKEFEARSKTASNSLQLAKNAATLVASNIGTALLPVVQKLAGDFVKVGAKIADFISKNQATVLKVIEVAGAIGGVVAAFHAMRLAVSLVGQPVMALYRAVCFLQTGTLQAKVAAFAHKVALLAQKAATLACTIATKAATVAQKLWTGAKNLAVLVLGKERAALIASKISMVAHKVATVASTAATKLMTGARNLAILALGKEKAAFVASKASMVAHKVAMVASKAAMLAWKVVCVAITAVQWAWNAAMSANPIGVVIMLIAGLVAGGIALWKNWDKVKAKCAELWQSIKKWFGKIGDWIGGIWAKIGGIWDKVTGFFGKGGGKKTVEVSQKVSGAQIPQMASGGIATKPTLAMIGEGSESEAVLPLSKLKGMLGGGGGGMSVNFAPVINVSGGAGDAYAGVKRGLEEGAASLKRELEKLMMGERRLSYY